MPGYKDPPKEHQFRKGQSGNPSGGSKRHSITAALLNLIGEKEADRKLAIVWLTKALEGDHRFFHELLDRIEGPIGLTAGHPAADDDIETLREFLKPKRRSRKK